MERKGIMALIFIKVQPKRCQVPAEEEISKMKGVVHIYEVLGEYDVCIHVHVKTKEELSKLLYAISMVKGVREVTPIVISKKVK